MTPPPNPPMSAVFAAIADYCLQQGWVPVGFRQFTVGAYRFTMNGTKTERDGVAPFHCAVEQGDLEAVILVNPFGGSITGIGRSLLTSIEDDVIAALMGKDRDDPAA